MKLVFPSAPELLNASFDARNIDQANAFCRAMYGPSQVERVPGQRTFLWQIETCVLGPIRITRGLIPAGARFTSQAVGDTYIFSLVRAGSITLEADGEAVELAPDLAGVVIWPGQRGVSRISRGTETLTVTVDREALEAHDSTLSGCLGGAPLRFAPRVDLSGKKGAGFARLVEVAFGECAHADGLMASPLMRANLCDTLLTAFLTAAPPDRGAGALAASVRSVAPGSVRRAEAWIDAHAGDPIRVADIATAAGVSLRALQESFRRSRGQTLMEFIKGRRLELARRWLLVADPELTVASVAAATGYGHVGRFAIEYRRRFGESPGETLREARLGGRVWSLSR